MISLALLLYLWTAFVLGVVAVLPDINVPSKPLRIVVWALLWPWRLGHLLYLMWQERKKSDDHVDNIQI